MSAPPCISAIRDLNKIHILLLQLAREDLAPDVRRAAALCLKETIDRHRADWTRTADELTSELADLQASIKERRQLSKAKRKKWTRYEQDQGEDKQALRFAQQLEASEREHDEYSAYLTHLHALLNLQPSGTHPFKDKISDLVPEFTLGDNNSVGDLQHYLAGPSVAGLVVGADGKLDEARSFRYINYFSLLAHQRVRNNPQPELSSHPIDFTAMRLPDGGDARNSQEARHVYWLYGDEDSQLLILEDGSGRIALRPIAHLTADEAGKIHSDPQPWRAGFPLHLFEDSAAPSASS